MQSENTQKTLSDDMVIDIYKYTNPKYETRSVLIYNNRAWHISTVEEFESALRKLNDGFGWDPSDRIDKLIFVETVSKQTHPHYFI